MKFEQIKKIIFLKQLFHELNIDFNIKQITLVHSMYQSTTYMPRGTYCTILFMGH